MIEIRLDPMTGLSTLTFSGQQSNEDIVQAGDTFVSMAHRLDSIVALCDWSDVVGWPCEPHSLPVYEWAAAAGHIERFAIIHHQRWRRQAAWLAALIRYGNGEVRSWRPEEAIAARRWLIAAREKLAAS